MTRRVQITAGVLAAVVLAVLAATAPPTAATDAAELTQTVDELVVGGSHSSASDFEQGTLDNAEVVRSGEAGAVSHDLARDSAAARWAFDAGSGSTAYDYVENNDATINGASWTTGPAGPALSFDGDDWVDAGQIHESPITVSAAINPSDSTGTIISTGANSGAGAGGYHLRIESGDLVWSVVAGGQGDANKHSISTSLPDGWTSVSASFSSDGVMRLVVDGEVVATDSHPHGTSIDYDSGMQTAIGSQGYDAPEKTFAGSIDAVGVWETALTPGLQTRLTSAPRSKLSSQSSERLAFDAGQGTTLYGDSGATGSLNDPAWTTGKTGQAIDLEQSPGELPATSSTTASSTVSFGGYVYWEDNESTGYDAIIHRTTDFGGRENGWGLRQHNDNDRIQAWVGDGSESSDAYASLTPGEWHHVWFVYESGSGGTLYVNGTAVASSSNIGDISVPEAPVTIGEEDPGVVRSHAQLDEFRFMSGTPTPESAVESLVSNPVGSVPETSSYQSGPLTVSAVEEAYTDLELHGATATVTWQTTDGTVLNQTTYSESGNYSATWSGSYSADKEVIVEFNPTQPDHTARLDDDGILFTNHAPQADNLSPPDNADLSSDMTEFSVDVSDAEFPTAQGDSVEASLFIDNEEVGSETVTSNQTVSIDHSLSEGGTHTYYWELADSYGATTTTSERTINVPSTLSIRSETAPSELVDNSSVNITYYYGDDIQRMSTSDGTVDLTGLPVDEPIIAVADAEGYHSRAAVITSIYEQDSIYLLNNSLEAHQLIFDITDPTGAYPRSETILEVQRDIELNGSTEWRTVAGDVFGAQGVTTDLQAGERYRLLIRNLESGERSTLGSFTPTGSQQITLEPESATVDVGLDNNTSIGYSASRSGDGESIIVEYADPTQSTTTLTFMIHQRFNESNVLVENQSFSDLGNISYSHPLSASEQNQSWVVDFAWTKTSGESSETSVVVGQGPRDGLIPSALDDVYRVSIGVAILLITALLFSQLNVGVGAITTSLVGGLLWYLGFLSGVTTGPAIVLAIGASGLIYYNNGGGAA